MSRRETSVLLADMLGAARRALEYAEGHGLDVLEREPMRRDAIIRQLEIVGEAASRVDEGTRIAAPEIPWADIIGMRNRLIHGYYVVDDAILWRTIAVRLPELVTMIERLVPEP